MQIIIVSVIVAAAAGYAAWQLMPQSMRHWLIGRLMVVAPSHRAWFARLEAGADNSGCDTCGGCAVEEKSLVSPGQSKIKVHRRGREKTTHP